MMEGYKTAFLLFCIAVLTLQNTLAQHQSMRFVLQPNPSIGPHRLSVNWTERSVDMCAISCIARYPTTCQSFIYSHVTKSCTPGQWLDQSQSVPTADEGDLYVMRNESRGVAIDRKISGVTTVSVSTRVTTGTPITTNTPIITNTPSTIDTPVTTGTPITTNTLITTSAPITTNTLTTTKIPITTNTLITISTPVTKSTQITTNTPISAGASISTNTSVTTNTPIITNTPLTTNTPVATTTPVTTNPPILTNSPVTSNIPAIISSQNPCGGDGFWLATLSTGPVCLVYVPMPMNYTEAVALCQSRNSHLCNVRSLEKLQFLHRGIKDSIWIGLDDLSTEGTFTWKDIGAILNTTMKSVLFEGGGQPDSDSYGEDCIILSKASGRLSDDMCQNQYGFICEKSI